MSCFSGRPVRLTGILVGLFLNGIGLAATSLPTGADVQDAESGRVLFRENYLALSSDGEPDFLSVQCSAVGGNDLRAVELDFTHSPWMPQVNVRAANGAELLLHYVNAKWTRESRAADSGRSNKSWPRLGKQTVLLGMLPFYLAANRDAIASGALDAVTVYEPEDNSQHRLKLRSETLMIGGSQHLRVDLYSGRLFSDDQKLISVEIQQDSGAVLRYVGPADVFCGQSAEGLVIKRFHE